MPLGAKGSGEVCKNGPAARAAWRHCHHLIRNDAFGGCQVLQAYPNLPQ